MAGPRDLGGKLPFNLENRNRFRSCGLLLGVVLLTGCKPEARAEKSSQRLVVADVILTVINNSGRSVQVSLESDSLAHIAGTVASRASRSFSLPSEMASSPSMLRLTAVHGDAPPMRSDDFEVRRGEQVVWTLEDKGWGTMVKR